MKLVVIKKKCANNKKKIKLNKAIEKEHTIKEEEKEKNELLNTDINGRFNNF